VFFRLVAGVGIFALGFYLGREVGRMEQIFGELDGTSDTRMPHAGTYDHEGSPDAEVHANET
jgi:hypothetical protein